MSRCPMPNYQFPVLKAAFIESATYEKEPRYNKTLLRRTHFASPFGPSLNRGSTVLSKVTLASLFYSNC